MSKHRRQANRGDRDREAEFRDLKEEMLEALDAIEASLGVRALFEERWSHIRRTTYSMATCYDMSTEGWAAMGARGDVEKRVEALEKLAREGKVSDKTLQKAAKAMAPAVEYLIAGRKVWAEEGPPPEAREELGDLAEQYMKKKLEPGEIAQAAAARGADLTVNQPTTTN